MNTPQRLLVWLFDPGFPSLCSLIGAALLLALSPWAALASAVANLAVNKADTPEPVADNLLAYDIGVANFGPLI